MSGLAVQDEAQAFIDRLCDDFEFFARNCLKIRTKSGAIVPLDLNRAQLHLHGLLERQRARTGRVRAILLKGRQQGISTYVEARYYWRLWRTPVQTGGLKAFILTHEQPATDNLFAITQQFHEHLPELLKPPVRAANAKELAFADADCAFQVATAGTKAIGRSATIQLFHGSEVGFWPNAESHIDGVFQAIPDVAGTESILESTANGIGNVFQREWAAAERGDSDYQPIFIPWFWDSAYATKPPKGWSPSPEWLDYKDRNGLSWPQLYWAYLKNRDMANAISADPEEPCWKYMQEYPSNAAEAFQSSGSSFIPAASIAAARRPPERVIGSGPLIIGVDPARGGDKTGVIDRRGRRMGELICERWDERDLMTLTGRIVRMITKFQPKAVTIDVGGLGAGVYDRLAELGWGHIVFPVNFGSSPLGIGPTGEELYANRRAEMWDLLRAWFEDPAGVQIPDDDTLHTDLAAPVYGPGATRYGSNNELTIESKDRIRERLGFSPDCFVAGTMVLTPGGERPVETLREGDEVITPWAVRRVLRLHRTTTDRVTVANFTHGRAIVGKGKHEVFTWDAGWVRLDALSLTNEFEGSDAWSRAKWLFANMWSTAGRSFRFSRQVDIISPDVRGTRSAYCIGESGPMFTEPFRRAMSSITRTATGATTISPIWNWSKCASTLLSTCESVLRTTLCSYTPIWKRRVSPLLAGIVPRKAVRGIADTVKKPGFIVKPRTLPRLAALVARCSRPSIPHRPDFVPAPAHRESGSGATSTAIEFVRTAPRPSWRTDTGKRNIALVSVRTEIGTREVFNLTLDEDNAYYANGVLVRNCGDAAALTFAIPMNEVDSGSTQPHRERSRTGPSRRTGY